MGRRPDANCFTAVSNSFFLRKIEAVNLILLSLGYVKPEIVFKI